MERYVNLWEIGKNRIGVTFYHSFFKFLFSSYYVCEAVLGLMGEIMT